MAQLPFSPRNRLSGSPLSTIVPIAPQDFACEILGEPVGRPILSEILPMPAELWVDPPVPERARPELMADDDVVELVPGIEELEALAGPEAPERELLEELSEGADRDDDELVLHSLRVALLAEAIARELGTQADDALLLRRAAVLHDVGKLVVPEDVLLKPGRLTPAEEELTKLHAAAGADLLEAGATPVLRLARVLALHHHERWDGSGYPAGLKGDATPLPARILAVADVFDALTHERPYKPAWSAAEAAAELARQRGVLHEDRIVAALFRVLARLHVRLPALKGGAAA